MSGKQAMPIRRGSLFISANIRVGGIIDRFALNKSHAGASRFGDVVLLARSANITSAVDDAFHPATSSIARWTHLFAAIMLGTHFDAPRPTFVYPHYYVA